jgi:hypothetical protein
MGVSDELPRLGVIGGAIFPDGVDLNEVKGRRVGHGVATYKPESWGKPGWLCAIVRREAPPGRGNGLWQSLGIRIVD